MNDSSKPWYLTTAIPYVNAPPHIGFAFEVVFTDALARLHRAFGEDVRFLTGTDDNALKNAQAAAAEGVPTKELVDRNAAQFEGLRQPLNLSFDDFIRTSSDQRHLRGVEKLWKACEASGDIFVNSYSGLYCLGCEAFYTEGELIDGLCPEHLTRPEVIQEENYFFRLSRYQDQLVELIESDRLRIVPTTRKNEVLSFVKSGLQDFSISRSVTRARDWGIPVPGDPNQVIYVWFDALGNYITALGYADESEDYQRYWVDNPRRVHVIGKGIIRFHAVYWPAMLLSAGVPLPTEIFVHGYLTIAGQKISKSLGNVIDPIALAEEFGTDSLRYYLLRRFPAADDGDFTTNGLIRTYNSELADQLGNLLSRVEALVAKYYEGVVPAAGPPEPIDTALIAKAEQVPGQVRASLDNFELHNAAAAVWELVAEANRYIVTIEPWKLAKERSDPNVEARIASCLYNLVEVLRLAAGWSHAFIPESSTRILERIGVAPAAEPFAEFGWGGYPAGTKLEGGPPLFPKREIDTA